MPIFPYMSKRFPQTLQSASAPQITHPDSLRQSKVFKATKIANHVNDLLNAKLSLKLTNAWSKLNNYKTNATGTSTKV